jgi:hypothetical protein
VIWNLNEGKVARPRSWKVLEGFRADVALLSEARFSPGPRLLGHGRTIGRDCKHEHEDDCQSRPFSTAIKSRYDLCTTTGEWRPA